MNQVKIFSFLILIALVFGACQEEVEPVTVSLSQTETSGMFLSSDMNKSVTVSITNNESNAAEITWERVVTNEPTGFTYMVNGTANMSGTVTVAAGATVDVTLMVHPNGNTGLASGTIQFYDEADKATTMKTYTYSLRSITEWFTATAVGLLTDSDRAINVKDYYIDVANPNPDTVWVTWEKVENTLPIGWNIAVCTDAVCWDPSVYTEEMPIAPNGGTVAFKATIDPAGNQGTCSMDAKFYVADDMASSLTTLQVSHTGTP